MNWWGMATVVVGFCLFVSANRWTHRPAFTNSPAVVDVVMVLLATPAALFAFHYTKLLGEPIWLYRLRALPGSELLAALAGVSAAWVQGRWVPRLNLSHVGKRLLVPVSLVVLLAIPYLKPVFRPLRMNSLLDTWRDEVCLQSSGATCGPASAATILRQFGLPTTERELAVESHTSASGTENWYLARALRKRGMKVVFTRDNTLQPSLPAIAGVRLKETANAGHFIALLARQDGELVVGDPLEGRSTNSLAELQRRYDFTGFFMRVRH